MSARTRLSATRGAAVLGLLLLAGLAALAAPAHAQDAAGVDGRITDAQGVPLRTVVVLIYLLDGDTPIQSTATDETGYFRVVPLAPGSYRVQIGRLGLRSVEERVEVRAGARTRLDRQLIEEAVVLEGISVEAAQSRARARFETEAGVTSRELSLEDILLLPGLAEGDPLRAIEVLPGVISTTDFSAAYNVRGGSSDQNLILLDGFPLFNPFHLGGFFSVFNADMVDRVELQSGGFPAEFGGRVSSVLRIESDPGAGTFRVDGGVSLLGARAAVAGGIPRGVTGALGLSTVRWRASARRSYLDQVARPVFQFPYHVVDLQFVADAWTRAGSRFSLTAYKGDDVLDLARLSIEDFPLRIHWRWGNELVGLRWNRSFQDGGAAEVKVGLSRFDTFLSFTDYDDSELASEVEQLTLALGGERFIGGSLTGKAGFGADRYRYANRVASGGTVFAGGASNGWALSAFGQLEWLEPRAWIVQAGLRWEGWRPDAGSAAMVLAPRVSIKRFLAGGSLAIKGSLGRYSQFVHSIRDEELPLGIDIWVLAGDRAPHVVSDQVQLGVEGFIGEVWFAAGEAFYRNFRGVVTNNFAEDPNDPFDDLAHGQGRGYGADFFLERRGDGPTGSASLSLLKADRTFPDFQSGREEGSEITYPPVFDRRADLDVVLRLPLGERWDIGARWHVGTGTPYTRPRGSYAYFSPEQTAGGRLRWQGHNHQEEQDSEDGAGGQAYAVVLGARNGERLPVYQRLDFGLRRTFRPSWGRLTASLDVLNVYNQSNVLFYFYDFTKAQPVRTGFSMFPFLPTIGVEVRF